jgi:hypothetical protein
MKKTNTRLLVLIFSSILTVTTAFGQAGPTWRVDENGPALLSGPIGGYANGSYKLDPLSGLTGWYYPLGPSIAGDLLLIEPLVGNTNTVSDLLRFDGQGVFFFSELEPGELNPDKADVPQIPNPVGSIVFVRTENGPEGNNGLLWTPGPGQPGFDQSGQLSGLSYNIISDVPEPNSVVLFLAAAGVLGWRHLRRKTA